MIKKLESVSSMPENPLIVAVLEILNEADDAISEHQLMKALEQENVCFSELAESQHLALFQKHFLIMNALYQLQQHLLDEQVYLHISPLAIYMRPANIEPVQLLPELNSDEHLRSYYTDWQNFQQASEHQVDKLLDQFWQLYLVQDKKLDAYQLLDLPVDASWPEVQKSYRQLAAQHHPDRGGDAVQFMEIREAYEILRP
jgi:DnaJ-domain-containing protein 1